MYCDMKVLIYPRRGVYVAKNRDEKYQMLKVLMHTLCVEELNVILKMSRNTKVIYHDEEGVVEIDVRNGKANHKDDIALNKLMNTINGLDDYSWEIAVVPQDYEQRKTTYNKSKNVLNPLMQIRPIIEVSL
jgi:hypothetical protein